MTLPRFGPYLGSAIKKAGLSRRNFAKIVGYASPNIDQVVAGKRVPPIAQLDKWSKALGGAVDPALFRELALLEHTPAEIRERYLALRGKSRQEP